MKIYDFIRKRDSYYTPKTPNSAYVGVTVGDLPKEYYIYISNFLHSPFETPGKLTELSEEFEFNRLKELERLLAKNERDVELEVQLIDILESLSKHSNPEIALFAAESINTIENSYNKDIYERKQSLNREFSINCIKEIIKLNYQYGYINRRKQDIRRFYYKEALIFFEKLEEAGYINRELLIIKIILLNYFNEFDHSRKLLVEYSDVLSYDLIVNLSCEIEYEDQNFKELEEIIKNIDRDKISPTLYSRLELWIE